MLVCHAPCAGRNPIPNELPSLVISDCDQLASGVLCFSHCLVLLECLQNGLLMLVGYQLEPAPAGEVISDSEAIGNTTSTQLVPWAGLLRSLCTSPRGHEAREDKAGKGSEAACQPHRLGGGAEDAPWRQWSGLQHAAQYAQLHPLLCG